MGPEKTINYYEENAKVFASETLYADMSSFYQPFLKEIKEGGLILDAGCGSGRDSLFFKKKGYEVEAMDASKEMCKEAKKVLNQEVRCCFFEDLKEEEVYDGIWCCASLLHVKKNEMATTLKHLLSTLKKGGIFYACWQKGSEERMVGERYYADYTKEQLEEMLKHVQGKELLKFWESEDVLQDPPRTKIWMNIIMKKV